MVIHITNTAAAVEERGQTATLQQTLPLWAVLPGMDMNYLCSVLFWHLDSVLGAEE